MKIITIGSEYLAFLFNLSSNIDARSLARTFNGSDGTILDYLHDGVKKTAPHMNLQTNLRLLPKMTAGKAREVYTSSLPEIPYTVKLEVDKQEFIEKINFVVFSWINFLIENNPKELTGVEMIALPIKMVSRGDQLICLKKNKSTNTWQAALCGLNEILPPASYYPKLQIS